MRIARSAAGLLFIGLIASSAALGSSGTRDVLVHAPPARLIGHSNSLNWAGYASFHSAFSDVKGSWTQPAATCNGKSTYASFWVGLDGYSSSTVEQLGTEADCSHGKPVYYAWWEMFPNVSHTMSFFTVIPGATYTAEVQSDGGDTFTLTLSGDGNSPFTLTTNLGLDPSLSSAE
jgi:Peptidase A4 family